MFRIHSPIPPATARRRRLATAGLPRQAPPKGSNGPCGIHRITTLRFHRPGPTPGQRSPTFFAIASNSWRAKPPAAGHDRSEQHRLTTFLPAKTFAFTACPRTERTKDPCSAACEELSFWNRPAPPKPRTSSPPRRSRPPGPARQGPVRRTGNHAPTASHFWPSQNSASPAASSLAGMPTDHCPATHNRWKAASGPLPARRDSSTAGSPAGSELLTKPTRLRR